MKIIIHKSLIRGFALGLVLSFIAVAATWAGFTGPNRTTTEEVRNPSGDQWYCDKSGYSRCWFATGNPCADEGGSHPSTSAQMSVCGWPSPADSCGCSESYSTQTVNLPAATVGGSESCGTPGNNGWCRGGASLELSASEPLSGEVIQGIEGNPGGMLCDPADSASIACSYSGGGEGNFTIEFWAVSSYGDTSDKGSASWKQDSTPPSIDVNYSGGTMGGGGWYRGGSVDVTVSGSDATSGLASAEVSVDGGAWASNATVGGDGVHSIQGRVTDGAGNLSSSSAEIRIDGTAPSLSPEISGTQGRDGWYISPVSVFASASDNLSGVSKIEVHSGSGGWQTGPVTISADGTHRPRFRASDVAGNETTEDGPTIKIDASAPASVFINPPEGSETWVSGIIPLIGQSQDLTSGLLAVEISHDAGESWSTPERAGRDWRSSWNSAGMPDGKYIILARARDLAGNLETTAQVTLLVDNEPPYVDIPDEWAVTASGALVVQESGVGLDRVEYGINDGEIPILTEVHPAASIPSAIHWDGKMSDGTSARPGEYAVTVVAVDLVGNRGSDAGKIIVPKVERAAAPDRPPETSAGQTSGLGGASASSQLESTQAGSVVDEIRVHPWIWPAVAWIGLLVGVGYAKVTDPRTKALRGLHDDISLVRKSLGG